MATAGELIAAGMPWLQATQIGSRSPTTALTAAGTTKADSLTLANVVNVISICGSGAGVSLPACAGSPPVLITNGGTNACLVYTGNTTDAFAAAACAGCAFSLTNGKSAIFYACSATWVPVLSA